VTPHFLRRTVKRCRADGGTGLPQGTQLGGFPIRQGAVGGCLGRLPYPDGRCYGEERTKDILKNRRHSMTLFPSVDILIAQTSVRVIRAVAVDSHRSRSVARAPDWCA